MMTIKLIFIFLLSLLLTITADAQVGIGTTSPDSSAILHLNDPKKGLLLTSIALTSSTDAVTIPSPAVGLLIWNNGTGGFSPAGLYYWNNSQWNHLSTGSGTLSSGWTTNASNSGLIAGAGTALSLGTNTYDDLIFKVNNGITGRLGVNNSVLFGAGTSASQNGVALGANAKADNNESIAIGFNSSAAGFQSVAMGYSAKTSSNSETALGHSAQTSGQNSTALGSSSFAGAQNSTAIGFGASTNQANAVVLGNSIANVGIGTNTPNTTTKLDVSGQYKLGEKGSVQKNQINFHDYPPVSIASLGAGQTTTLNIAIPAGSLPTSTRATVTVTPAGDFLGTTFLISNARLSSTSNVVINLTNISATAANLYSAQFYVMINEF